MNKVFFYMFICLSTTLFAQPNIEQTNFNHIVSKVKGHLNQDNLIDYVLVSQDTINAQLPYKLEIFFGQPNGEHKLIVASTNVIESESPDGEKQYYKESYFSDIIIKNKVLSIIIQLTRGHYEHKFRFQNNNFELIGYTFNFSDGRGTFYTTDFNLSTGIRIEKSGSYDSDKILSKTRQKILIRPLPKLQDFQPDDNELY